MQIDRFRKQIDIAIEIIETVILAAAFSIIIYITIATPNKIDGSSMNPSFFHNDLILTNKTIQYWGRTPFGESRNYDYKRGDVIVFKLGEEDLIKRIIAEGGDTIEILNDKVYINGSLLKELYLPTTTRTRLPSNEETFLNEGEELTVPLGSYFVMGDNREASKDSRFKDIGFVQRNLIKGRVDIRYWPPSRADIIRRGEYQIF